jgi:hypothetical protein
MSLLETTDVLYIPSSSKRHISKVSKQSIFIGFKIAMFELILLS